MDTNTNAIEALRNLNNPETDAFVDLLEKGEPFIQQITPSLADHIRTCCGGRNRNLSMPHVNRLALAMRNGEWQFNNATIGFFDDGRLSDGQHRLAACIEADYSFKTIIVPNLDQEAILTVDQQSKTRKAQDYLSMIGVDRADDKAFIATNYLKLISGDRGFSGPAPSNTAVKRYVDNNNDVLDDYLKEADAILMEANNKVYNSRSAALWLFTADKNTPHYRDEARLVLKEIVTGVGEDNTSPGIVASKLLNDLASRKKRETLNMNRRIGTTMKALNLTIAGKKATVNAVKYPNRKGERFPSLAA